MRVSTPDNLQLVRKSRVYRHGKGKALCNHLTSRYPPLSDYKQTNRQVTIQFSFFRLPPAPAAKKKKKRNRRRPEIKERTNRQIILSGVVVVVVFFACPAAKKKVKTLLFK